MDAKQIARAKELIEQLCELAKWFPWTEYPTRFTEIPNRVRLYTIEKTANSFAVDPAKTLVYYMPNYGTDEYHRVEVGGYEMSSWLNGLFTKALEDEVDALRVALPERRDLIAKAMVAVWAAPLWPFKEWWDGPDLFYETRAWNTNLTKQVRLFTTQNAYVATTESYIYRTVRFNITEDHEVAVSTSWVWTLGPNVYRIVDPKNLPDDYLELIVRAFSAPHRPPGRGEGKRHR